MANRWILGTLVAMQAACSGCGGPATGAQPPENEPAAALVASPGGAMVRTTAAEAPQQTVGFRFQPQSHSPRPTVTPLPLDVSRLPRLVTRSCSEPAAQAAPTMGWQTLPQPRPRAPRMKRARSAAPRAVDNFDGSAASSSGSGAPAGKSTADRVMPKPAVSRPAPSPEPATPAKRPPSNEDRLADNESAEGQGVVSEVAPGVLPQDDAPSRGGYHDWGASIYLSNDDTMSLSSAQRVITAIDKYLPLPAEHIRPHEMLNYFSFAAAPVERGQDFSVLPALEEKPGHPGEYSLGLSITGRPLTLQSRRNAALTLVVDRSGSMASEGRMEYLKRGLAKMTSELKDGDIINLVQFDHAICTPLENFVVGRDSMRVLAQAIKRLGPGGSTNLEGGLRRGYELADASYQPTYGNRVLLITDALANTGVTNEDMIALIGQNYDRRRIRLSGIGVGSDFNDSLLDRLTEKGRGAYVFLGSEAETDAVFGPRFVSLIETVANDVHFRLHLPPSLRMNVFYGEESSVEKRDVQAIHYFAGTNQMFLSDLVARDGGLPPQDEVMLTIEYHDPDTDQALVEEYAFSLGDMLLMAEDGQKNVAKARFLMSFVDGLSDIARRPHGRSSYRRSGWHDDEAVEQCERGRESLRLQATALPYDPEVARVVDLWDTFCSRYRGAARTPRPAPPVVPMPRPVVPQDDGRHPYKRQQPTGADVWPGGSSR